jgi:hypothetical protein
MWLERCSFGIYLWTQHQVFYSFFVLVLQSTIPRILATPLWLIPAVKMVILYYRIIIILILSDFWNSSNIFFIEEMLLLNLKSTQFINDEYYFKVRQRNYRNIQFKPPIWPITFIHLSCLFFIDGVNILIVKIGWYGFAAKKFEHGNQSC